MLANDGVAFFSVSEAREDTLQIADYLFIHVDMLAEFDISFL